MKLKKVKSIYGGFLYEPCGLDKPIFEHCCGGLCSITKEYFYTTAYPVLKMHGIDAQLEGEKPV